jgi:hypothetical protein
MHKKYAKDGLAAFSCALDDPKGKDIKDKLLKFLKEKKATFPNFLLNEKPEDWQEKLKIVGPPAVFVIDREGKPAKKFNSADEDFTYADVEKVVAELMKKK